MGAIAAAMFSVGMSLAAVACGSQPNDVAKADAKAHAVVPIASVGAAVAARTADVLLDAAHSGTAVSPISVSALPSSTPPALTGSGAGAGVGADAGLVVKRFVVAQGVREREPVVSGQPLSANGRPVFAFAELANEDSNETHVRITFERKGSRDRVGHVTLAVPAKTGRFRTWGQTRFVREAGEWEAVLWSESGKELGRAAFEVVDS